MSQQLIFDLPQDAAMGIGDFFVSSANTHAHSQVLAPSSWPQGKLCLVGPEGAGKSHLARVFAAQTGAAIVNAAQITDATPRPTGATVIEDADHLSHDSEEWLFHHHNALSNRAPLLLTARREPAHWAIRLPDLASRMQATSVARIAAPDDALLGAVLLKLFADRQITPDPALPPYLIARIPRSFAALGAWVDALDAAALSTRRQINKSLASDLITHRVPGAPDLPSPPGDPL